MFDEFWAYICPVAIRFEPLLGILQTHIRKILVFAYEFLITSDISEI
jgi:hypothetical protein